MNMCSSSSIGRDIPDNRWYGRHGNYRILRTFGCKAFAAVKQGKLEARAIKCIMLGYQTGVKGYRLWCIEPGNGKVIISRDVIFWEHDLPFKSPKTSEPENVVMSEIEVEAEAVQQDGADSNIDSQTQPTTSTQSDSSKTPGSYRLARDRGRRVIKPPARYSDAEFLFFCLITDEEIEYSEPSSYEEAVESKEYKKWMQAMIEEIDSLLKNGTWVLVEKPDGRRVVSCKWIFKKKIGAAEHEDIRYKARLVARGFTQEHGIDYDEVFSPV